MGFRVVVAVFDLYVFLAVGINVFLAVMKFRLELDQLELVGGLSHLLTTAIFLVSSCKLWMLFMHNANQSL